MALYDVFNGDADGICALQQLRLAEPAESTLVTGVKRDIALLERVQAGRGDRVTVLDVSLDKNRDALLRLLGAGARVLYLDHHFPGEIPEDPHLEAVIDTDAAVCTSLLADRRLGGRYRAWAVTGAFGDNLHDSALVAARTLEISGRDLDTLRELGTLLNYNGYGATVEDLHFHPAELFRRLHPYADPLAFAARDEAFARLRAGYEDDMRRAQRMEPRYADEHVAVWVLPAEPWARRVGGVFANELARGHPGRAHALLTAKPEGGYVVSIRAPLSRREGADALARQFPTGGGRAAAAGINHLPEEDLERFVAAFRRAYE